MHYAKLPKTFAAFAFLGLTTVTTATLAAPSISSVNGDLAHDSTITIKGSGFGSSGPTPSRTLWDTVDNQSTYSKLSNGATIPTNQGIWTRNGNPWSTPVVIERNGDTRSSFSKAVFKGKARSYLGWPRTFEGLSTNSIYVTWWFKPSREFSSNGGSNKVIRVWDDSEGMHTRAAWTQMHLQYDTIDLGISNNVSWGDWGGKPGEWNRLEFMADGSTRQLKTWINGKLVHDIKDYTKSPISNPLSIALVGLDANDPAKYSDLTFLMDDIYASPTQARVEISTSPEWSGATNNKEVQFPVSWSDKEIKIEVNQGSLKSLNKAYLYIVDKNGNVNQKGYPLSVCTKCPVSPVLKVVSK